MQKFNIKSLGFLDKLIFKKISDEFGGNIKELLCGGASVDVNLIKYLQAVLGISVIQGYGQTEGLGANILATKEMNDFSTVGTPFVATKIKLVDIHSGSAEKALFMKGLAITKGYFQPSLDILEKLLNTGKFSFKIENIRESPFDEDGWLITGDVVIYRNSKLYVIGRTKDLVKLDNGEYISPENIENKLRETEFIKDVFISKIPGEDKFVALVSVIDEKTTLESIAKYLKNSINQLIDRKVIPRCVEISKYAVIRENFAEIDGGNLFTPTLKKKRFIFALRFEKELKNAISIEDTLMGVSFSRSGILKKIE